MNLFTLVFSLAREKSNNLAKAGIQWFFRFGLVITEEHGSQGITSCIVGGVRSGGERDRLDRKWSDGKSLFHCGFAECRIFILHVLFRVFQTIEWFCLAREEIIYFYLTIYRYTDWMGRKIFEWKCNSFLQLFFSLFFFLPKNHLSIFY